MNVSGLMASFATGTYTVTRTAHGSVVAGKTVAGTTTSVSVSAAIWPANNNDLMRLPENRRTTDAIALMTSSQIYIGGQGTTHEADKISYLGETWEAADIDVWTDSLSGATAYKCIFTVIR